MVEKNASGPITFLLDRFHPLLEGVLDRRAGRMAKLVASERSWRLQILTEPRSELVQFLGVGARDVLRLQRPRCLK